MSNHLRYAVKIPYLYRDSYMSKHKTLEAAEKAVRCYTRKFPSSACPSIVDLTTGKYV